MESLQLLGSVGAFEEGKEDWGQYVERAEHFFDANAIQPAERKKACFLTLMGAPTYKLLSSLIAPAKPAEKSYDQIVEALKKHYCPKAVAIMQRFEFNSQMWQPGESI